MHVPGLIAVQNNVKSIVLTLMISQHRETSFQYFLCQEIDLQCLFHASAKNYIFLFKAPMRCVVVEVRSKAV